MISMILPYIIFKNSITKSSCDKFLCPIHAYIIYGIRSMVIIHFIINFSHCKIKKKNPNFQCTASKNKNKNV